MGFSRHGVTPDVVTMGKPMGNGFPMSGLAAREELLAVLNADVGYFNTSAAHLWPWRQARRCWM
ncbi:hypothetical protein ACU8V3_12970 [Cobetia marina]